MVVERVDGVGKSRGSEEGREINFYLPGTSLGVSGGPKGGRT